MGVADSGGPYVYATFAGDTPPGFVAGIKDQLVAAGWTATAVTGGWSFLGVSPQGLSVKVKIWDPGGSDPIVNFQFSSASATGIERRVLVGTGFEFQIVANPCQFFLSRPGLAGLPSGSVVCGGVPWVPESACGGSTAAEAAEEAWWAMSDFYGSPFFPAHTLRTMLLHYTTFHGMGEAVWNGVFAQSATALGSFGQGVPEIVAITYPGDIDGGSFNQYETRWYPDTALVYEPLIAWGDTLSAAPVVRGQLWDAVVLSKDYPMDSTYAAELAGPPYDARSWINFTDSYFWGSLWLIRGGGGGGTPEKINYIY
jgi:hypothetical protein